MSRYVALALLAVRTGPAGVALKERGKALALEWLKRGGP